MAETARVTTSNEPVTLASDFYIRQKRPHKKSRHGCLTCKKRRVKCDERFPYCKVCMQRGIECTYAESRRGSPESRGGSPAGIAAPLRESLRWEAAGEVDDLAFRPTYRQTPDKLFFYYYLNHVGGTFASTHNDPDLARMWRTGVPSVAFAYRGVSHAIMAVSALCMGSIEEHARSSTYDHQATAELHYSQAVKHFRTSMETLDQANIDAVLACCMALVPYSLAVSRIADEARLVGDWLVHIRGFATLGDSLTGSDVGGDSIPSPPSPDQLVIYPQPSNPGLDMALSSSSGLVPQSSSVQLLQNIRQSGQETMENLRQSMDPRWSKLSTEDVEACLGALSGLDTLFDYALQGRAANYSSAVFHWLIMLPQRFVQLLYAEAEAALAIFAYWLVTTAVMDDMWWMRGFGSSRIRRIAERFERSGGVYQSCIEWPVGVLNRLNMYG